MPRNTERRVYVPEHKRPKPKPKATKAKGKGAGDDK